MKINLKIDITDYNDNTEEYIENKIHELTDRFLNELAIRFIIDADFKLEK